METDRQMGVSPPLRLTVSAIMPAFNAEHTIGAAIRSVQTQTLRDWELIVISDGSTDRTFDVAQEIAASDPRIMVSAGKRAGRGSARNACIERVRGAFVAICDSDDVSLPDRFEREVHRLSLTGADVVACSRVIAFTQSGERFILTGPVTDEETRSALKRGRMPLHFASAMIRSSVFERFGGFDPELLRGQDFGFFLGVMDSIRFESISDSLILYRTPGRLTTWRIFRENNFFRYYARLRAEGDSRSSGSVRHSTSGWLYTHGVIPAQFVWYSFRRLVLRRDVLRPTSAEAALCNRTLSDLGLEAGAR